MTADNSTIVSAKIHPSIGIARVGNSTKEEGFYIGPQVINPEPMPAGFYRDDTGALKREVAEFRVYGYNAQGEVVKEITAEDAELRWQVQLANHKPAWYNFELALDIPEAASAPKTTRRNAKIEDRSSLSIKPGARKIHGVSKSGSKYLFDGGTFCGVEVGLGELRTDEVGRLRVFGGHGKSASIYNVPPTTFANNDGWYDDTSDGPVTATVKIDGKTIDVAPAWVVVAPPNYGPQQKSVRTMFALMTDLAIQSGMLPVPGVPSFQNEILPILRSMSDLQWMNAGFAAGFGWGAANYFLDEELLQKLSSKSKTWEGLRRTIATSFRNPADGDISMKPWPWIYGDAMDIPMPQTVNAMNSLTTTQLVQLERWANGQFIDDYCPSVKEPKSIDDVPLESQPFVLDQAALEFCLADAFHPGCEMTWPVRHATMYMEPYRWRHRPDSDPEPDFGSTLTPQEALSFNGPLYAQFPGSITRWMAIPWQTDTASCRSGYDPKYDPYLPTFWPARVPNQVLSEQDYETVMDTKRPLEERLAAFNHREDWDRTLGAGYMKQLENMITRFPDMGIVEVRPGIANDPNFPPLMQVEDRGGICLSAEERQSTDSEMRKHAIEAYRKP